MKKIFITTTLPYINGASLSSPGHIGHALEFFQADALARYFRDIKKNNVFFNVGVDEHGLKVYNKSQELGINTQEYCDLESARWIIFLSKLDIQYDNFYRTTSALHK